MGCNKYILMIQGAAPAPSPHFHFSHTRKIQVTHNTHHNARDTKTPITHEKERFRDNQDQLKKQSNTTNTDKETSPDTLAAVNNSNLQAPAGLPASTMFIHSRLVYGFILQLFTCNFALDLSPLQTKIIWMIEGRGLKWMSQNNTDISSQPPFPTLPPSPTIIQRGWTGHLTRSYVHYPIQHYMGIIFPFPHHHRWDSLPPLYPCLYMTEHKITCR